MLIQNEKLKRNL